MNLMNNDINENHMIFIKEMMIEMMTFWSYLISNILYHYYKIIKINISNINSWYNIKSIIYYLAKSNLKNIHINLSLKYISKKIIEFMKIINNDKKLSLYKYELNKIFK